jgi:phosphopantetheine adenylyltransferase/predicted metal-dependent HD superfamily phosphohydrolase
MEIKNRIKKIISLKKFVNRKLLSILNSEIYITNVTFDMFNISQMKNNEKKQNIVSFLIYVVNNIIEKTEGTTTLNIIFDLQNSSEFTDNNDPIHNKPQNISQLELLNIPFKDYERIFFLFYSCATLTKFIENKKFTVRFPQLINYSKESKSEYNHVNEIYNKILDGKECFLVDIFDKENCSISDESNQLIQDLMNQDNLIEDINKKKFYYINQEDLSYYLSDNNYIPIETKVFKDFLIEELITIESAIITTPENLPLFAFDFVALGGTFDHFHMGHNMLLTTAALLSKKRIGVGVCSNEMILKKAKCCVLQSYEVREANVRESLEKVKLNNVHLDIFMLQDGVGKAGTQSDISALIVTGETLKGGHYVNEVRKKNGLNEIPLIIANLILDNNWLSKKYSHKTLQELTLKDNITIPKKFLGENTEGSQKQNEKENQIEGNLNLERRKSQTQDYTKISSTSIRKKISENITLENLETLEKYWLKLTLSILKGSKEICINWFSRIRDLYSQSWRMYHSLTHIINYVICTDELFKEGKIHDYVNVQLAVWFHDIIYTPSRSDNEERSCKEFLEFYENIKRGLVLENTVEMIDPNKVINYIMATKSHFDKQEYNDKDINYFLDVDLISLGEKCFEDYMKLNSMIKYEFTNHLTEEEWVNGRRKFLEMVLCKEHIFRTDDFRLKYEENARRNILKELELLVL